MKLLFERSVAGRQCTLLEPCDVPEATVPAEYTRATALGLPQLSELDISRHYTELMKQTFGVNNGFYPLGSCTMKYNPRLNEEAAANPGFAKVHPLQPEDTVQGSMEVLYLAEQYYSEITGMDRMTFQPAAGAHGELTGIMLINAYHKARGDSKRTKIIVPDSAHGTNPATASMVGYQVVTIPSAADGRVDLEKLRAVVGEDTAGLMLTNPNTIGLFDSNILEITKIIHDAGGLCYYDGANLNAVMGIVRPGDMGFDVVHLNLHKTFSTPHGGGGPGSGPVGCKNLLADFLPGPQVVKSDDGYAFEMPARSIGKVRSFYGNFLVVVRALTYAMTLGREGIPEAAGQAVLNANYMKSRLQDLYDVAYGEGICMHEFVLTLEGQKKKNGVTAMDIAKSLLDFGMHPPTMYFPLLVPEALMIEPTETESKETLDAAIEVLRQLYELAQSDPDKLHQSPVTTPIGRPDEVTAARNPILRYQS